jgi:predicted HNH restriction endonuclease
VPEEFSPRFLALLGVSGFLTQFAAEASDVEGIQTELRRVTKKRSRRLRELALSSSGGICEVCKRDYSKVLAGRGIRVLQVHHRKQLASLDEPAITKLSDLAVVCANCHMLIHLDPRRAFRVETLRRKLVNA